MRETTSSAKELLTHLLNLAGIQINGNALWDIQVHNEDFYKRVLKDQELGLGETYVEGWWDCQRIDLMIARLAKAKIEKKLQLTLHFTLKLYLAKIFNFQSKARAFEVGRKHYDIGNDLFEKMLDENMNYTCGYWKNAQTLEQAQLDKLDLVCRKLFLSPGMRLLDIGCGWGALAKFAAEKYGVEVVGITISKNQFELAKLRCQDLPIDIRLQDYREITGKFDRVASLGMFEHVGHLNYRRYMQIVNNCLVDDGIFLLHTIGGNQSTSHATPWISKYIFPNSMIPSIMQIGKAVENLLIMEDWHNFGTDYYETLMTWHHNFNQGWDSIKQNYDPYFYRRWNYFLLYCAGGFMARDIQLWQIVFSKNGIKGGYLAPR